MRSLVALLSTLVLFAFNAQADEYHDRVLVLGNGYAAGPGGFPVNDIAPVLGGTIAMVGTISEVNGYFDDLLPAGPHELTYVFAGATCTSYSTEGFINCPYSPWGLFMGGTLSLYLDTTPDADFTSGDTFTDGELVLIANQVEHRIDDMDGGGDCADAPDWNSIFVFYGGTWYPRISSPPFLASLAAEIDGDMPAELMAKGFTFHVTSGDIDLHYNVATRPVSWGYVKSLYR